MKTKRIHTFIAAGLVDDGDCGDGLLGAEIHIDKPIPQLRKDDLGVTGDILVDSQMQFAREAIRVVDVMYKHMPGGLTDAIFAELCSRKACALHVPLDNFTNNRK